MRCGMCYRNRERRFTNTELGHRTGKSKQQVQKYLKNWLALNLVLHAEKVGRSQFYEIDPRFAVLIETIILKV